MYRGRNRLAWIHTSQMLAKLHNVNVAKRSQLLTPFDFDPFMHRVRQFKPAGRDEIQGVISSLKASDQRSS